MAVIKLMFWETGNFYLLINLALFILQTSKEKHNFWVITPNKQGNLIYSQCH